MGKQIDKLRPFANSRYVFQYISMYICISNVNIYLCHISVVSNAWYLLDTYNSQLFFDNCRQMFTFWFHVMVIHTSKFTPYLLKNLYFPSSSSLGFHSLRWISQKMPISHRFLMVCQHLYRSWTPRLVSTFWLVNCYMIYMRFFGSFSRCGVLDVLLFK